VPAYHVLFLNPSNAEKPKMSETFQLGDVVVLKSGGPKMTVSMTGDDSFQRPTVWCDWFEGNKKISGTFPPSSLKLEK